MNCQKTAKLLACAKEICQKSELFLAKYFAPILLLSLRIMIGLVFLKSGLTKISNFETTILLFENEYNVPVLSPAIAAYLATFFELTCSVLLMGGLLTKLATLPLIGMTLVIQFFVIQNPEHFYWLAILSTILTFGGGVLSLDFIATKLCKQRAWCNKNK